MARYQVTLRDALPFLRRRLAWSVGGALLVLVVAGLLAAMLGRGGPEELGMFGIGIGAAIGLLTDAYIEHQRVRQLYRGAETVELTVAPDRIVFVTESRAVTVHRTPAVMVVESHGAFLVTMGRGEAPVLVPVRHLAASEQDTLRQWQAG